MVKIILQMDTELIIFLTYDCSYIPKETMDRISGSEIIILDALKIQGAQISF